MKKRISLIALLAVGLMAFAYNHFTGDINPAADEQLAALNVGDKAPEIELASPDGKELKLSDLKGQVVLIDFWASWCRPCRMENPNVVKVYNRFKDAKFKNGKGFTVFSVSLDRSKEQWVKAIEDDGLIWPWHVSDLKFWSSEAARTYNVNAIPQTFLIDGDGIIIAKNPRGPMLESTLDRLRVR